MITGVHAIVFSQDADAKPTVSSSVTCLAGNTWMCTIHDGWLIFAQPPAELAVHPWPDNSIHRLYLMSDDLDNDIAALRGRGVEFLADVVDEGFGAITSLPPRGGEMHLYQPTRPSPLTEFSAPR